MGKKFIVILLAFIICLHLSSCNQREIVVAYSTDYVGEIKFKSDIFDVDKIIDMRYSTSPYFYYTCYVSKNEGYDKREDRLVVSNECSEKIKTVIAGSGWFVGVDYSEFLSGIMYYPSTSGREFGGMEPKMVLGENCVGLFEINNVSVDEYKKYISIKQNLQKIKMHSSISMKGIYHVEGYVQWLLRTESKEHNFIVTVFPNGKIDIAGTSQSIKHAVRPAIWLRIY